MKKKWIMAVLNLILFGALICLLLYVDVESIGPEGTRIGLSTVNGFVHKLTGVNMLWYDLTRYLGYAALGVAALFALTGLIQLIARRSLLKVDGEIYALAVLYAVTAGLYVLFEKVIINYRPVILPDEVHPEASFPSSHTMLVCVVMGSAAILIARYIRNKALRIIPMALCVTVLIFTVIGRLLSGVHWFTDILGGALISAALVWAFSAIASAFRR